VGRERGREGVELVLRFLEGGSAIVWDLIMLKNLKVCGSASEFLALYILQIRA